ncbi:hypothetical protein HMPREF1062_02049 [Bacteroides cellulosilyticus CL02T12C19]|uniref:Uncharacterized protein n=1 Tax=Bacteroides cellulosilyticus CL02T12C19 TaxID=997874 RepID=I9QSQ3_9BACE|nr:hypothetical protein HMPREF1062_02049 [Bacteroides cellulosilyticus CL02T12C19]
MGTRTTRNKRTNADFKGCAIFTVSYPDGKKEIRVRPLIPRRPRTHYQLKIISKERYDKSV